MAIRLRRIEGVGLIALCAARSVEHPGDVYLDDEVHHALGQKFTRDYIEERLIEADGLVDVHMAAAVDVEESNNPAREWWDQTYGAGSSQPEHDG